MVRIWNGQVRHKSPVGSGDVEKKAWYLAKDHADKEDR